MVSFATLVCLISFVCSGSLMCLVCWEVCCISINVVNSIRLVSLSLVSLVNLATLVCLNSLVGLGTLISLVCVGVVWFVRLNRFNWLAGSVWVVKLVGLHRRV